MVSGKDNNPFSRNARPDKEAFDWENRGRQNRDRSRSPPPQRWERRIRDAKKAHRPRLRHWGRDKFGVEGTKSSAAFEALDWERDRMRGIARESREDLTPEEFWEHYERRRLPVVLSGIPSQEGWRTEERWSLENLDRRYRQCKLKCGEDDDGYSVKVKLKYFLRYMEHQSDDSPLYIFDSHFDDHEVAKALLEDFRVPSYFPDDLFSLVGERRRPPYRWFLVGPKRSGTSVHIDPLGTSAWNTVVSGRKLWVLFPPHVDKHVARGKEMLRDGEDDEPVRRCLTTNLSSHHGSTYMRNVKLYRRAGKAPAPLARVELSTRFEIDADDDSFGKINYFVDLLPRIRRKYGESIKIYEFVQYPGDTVFVPGGWHHAVLNLDDTIAITQNFCSHRNFEKVWRKTRTGRKKMAVKWLRELEKEYPHLARTARRLNTEDGFVMDDQGRRGSDHDRDGDDGRQKGKKSNKRSNTRDNTQSNSLGKRRKRESDGDSPSSRSGTSSSSNI